MCVFTPIQVVYNATVEFDVSGEGSGELFPLTYSDLCATYNGYCYENEILRLATIMPDVEQGNITLTYPIFFDPNTFMVRIYPQNQHYPLVDILDPELPYVV